MASRDTALNILRMSSDRRACSGCVGCVADVLMDIVGGGMNEEVHAAFDTHAKLAKG